MAPYSDQRWLTFRQAAQLGGNVRRGERSSLVVFWKQHQVTDERDGEEVTRTIPLLRYFNLFNVAQCDGLNLAPVPANHIEPIEAAMAIVDGMPNPPRITHDGGDRAYYVPATDSIHLPAMSAFDGAGEFYSTAFHELTHSTGHKSRLNRESLDTPAPFGSPIYSREELVAEFGAAFLSAQAGIDNTIENSAAYIDGWSRALRADKRLVITAASQGQKAADYVLGGE
jgi:antirestriction protein ArdC